MARMNTLDDLHRVLEGNLWNVFQGHPSTPDYIQEAKVAIWQRLEADPDTGYGLLLTLGRNRAIDVARGQRHFGAPERSRESGSRKPVLTSYEAATDRLALDTTDPIPALENAMALEEALAVLDEDERWIVDRAMEGMSQREMADERGVSQAWVSRRRLPAIRAKLTPFLPALRAA